MAYAKKCDRCGGFYQPSDFQMEDVLDFKTIKIKIKYMTLRIKDENVNFNDIDLCPNCCRSFAQFMGNKEVKPGA